MLLKWCKVKCTPVQALRLCTGHTAYRESRGIALPFHDHSMTRGWRVSVMPWLLFIPGKDPVPIVQEAGWAPGPVWTGAENLAPTGIWSPDRKACSQSLYQLCYPAHLKWCTLVIIFCCSWIYYHNHSRLQETRNRMLFNHQQYNTCLHTVSKRYQ